MGGSTIYLVIKDLIVCRCLIIKLGSGRNPRRQQKKMKAKERGGYLYGGYDSSEEFGSSPYVRYGKLYLDFI